MFVFDIKHNVKAVIHYEWVLFYFKKHFGTESLPHSIMDYSNIIKES